MTRRKLVPRLRNCIACFCKKAYLYYLSCLGVQIMHFDGPFLAGNMAGEQLSILDSPTHRLCPHYCR